MARDILRHMILARAALCDLGEKTLDCVMSRRVSSHSTATVLMAARPRRYYFRMCR